MFGVEKSKQMVGVLSRKLSFYFQNLRRVKKVIEVIASGLPTPTNDSLNDFLNLKKNHKLIKS